LPTANNNKNRQPKKMKILASPTRFFSGALCAPLVSTIGRARAAFKCQGADSKIEYSDRAYDTTKTALDKPDTSKTVQSNVVANPIEQLQKFFADLEPRLCEREALAAELDLAGRSGEITKAPLAWRSKQNKRIGLNDIMVEFQLRARNITKPAGNASAETAARQKFQTCSPHPQQERNQPNWFANLANRPEATSL
jgi:hypothetical protein